MSQKKPDRKIWQHRFNLSSDNPDDVRLHEFLVSLASDGKAAVWIRNSLASLVAPQYNSGTSVVQQSEPSHPSPFKQVYEADQSDLDEDVRYEDAEEFA